MRHGDSGVGRSEPGEREQMMPKSLHPVQPERQRTAVDVSVSNDLFVNLEVLPEEVKQAHHRSASPNQHMTNMANGGGLNVGHCRG